MTFRVVRINLAWKAVTKDAIHNYFIPGFSTYDTEVETQDCDAEEMQESIQKFLNEIG